jgi:hypothetical protein
MRKSLPKRDQLLLRIGAAKKEAGRAFRFVKIQLPDNDQPVTRSTLHVSCRQSEAQGRSAARRPLSAAQQSHW